MRLGFVMGPVLTVKFEFDYKEAEQVMDDDKSMYLCTCFLHDISLVYIRYFRKDVKLSTQVYNEKTD